MLFNEYVPAGTNTEIPVAKAFVNAVVFAVAVADVDAPKSNTLTDSRNLACTVVATALALPCVYPTRDAPEDAAKVA